MKKASIVVALIAAVCLVGCENKELVTCQQENQTLQQQVKQVQAAVAEKDQKIEAMKAENTAIQTKAMESIKTMMEKQGARDTEVKKALDAKTREVSELQKKLQAAQTAVAELQKQLEAAAAAKPAAPAPAAPAQ
ncbi:MAG: hypothetical protein L0Y36_09580 [Planctomycetales bacterium]|nr:hypothetical protein [Planctomycetales bacterium]